MRCKLPVSLSAFSVLSLALAAGLAPTALAQSKVTVGMIELEGPLHEQPSPLAWLMGSAGHTTVSDAVGAIDTVAKSAKHGGLLIRLKDAQLSRANIDELGAAITRARAAGKKVHVFSEGYSTSEIMLGSYANSAFAQPGTPVMFSGMHAEEMFLADTLAWAGVKADFVQVGDYKGASEQMVNSRPSPAWDQNINQLMDSIYANMRQTIGKGRAMDDAKLDAAMKALWLADAEQAVAAGVIDAVVDLPEITATLDKAYGAEVSFDDSLLGKGDATLDTSNPFTMLSKLSQKPDTTPKRSTIAVLHLDGTIVDGESSDAGFMGGGGSVGSRSFRASIEELIEQDLIKGVVVRINSPGGSATASEVMWQGLKKLAAHKPVWVSIGDMAASGGYYTAVGGQRIYINPSSIVGSIGVVGGRLGMDGLYKMLKVNVVDRSRGPNAEMFRSTSPWTKDEVALVRSKMTETYNQFTARVVSGRPGIDLTKTAEGRLFTGNKAIELKMADKIGGLHDAVGDLAGDLKLDAYDVMHFPGPKSLPEVLEETFSRFAQAPGVSMPNMTASPIGQLEGTAQQIFGPAWTQIRQNIVGAMQLRKEPVLLMSPSFFIFQ